MRAPGGLHRRDDIWGIEVKGLYHIRVYATDEIDVAKRCFHEDFPGVDGTITGARILLKTEKKPVDGIFTIDPPLDVI